VAPSRRDIRSAKDLSVSDAVNDEALDVLFRGARTHRNWREGAVTPQLLMAIYDLARWGPTTNNTNPARFVFLVSPVAKARLKPHLSRGNVDQTMAAPATAIIAYDLAFYELMGKLNPASADARERWAQRPAAEIEDAALRSGTLTAGYFILAARALGLDCGPMGGFNREGVDAEFFAGTRIKSNILCNLGYGDPAGLRPRAPRLDFDEACRIL
jgi:3-hydroxypropanoate dehydrogenase